MHEVRLLLKKDLIILVNNLLLIFRNPLRLIPYGLGAGYFVFMYSQGIAGSERVTSQVNVDAAGEVDVTQQILLVR